MSKQQANEFQVVLVISTGFLLLFWWQRMEWLLITALIVGLAGSLVPFLRKMLTIGWMMLAGVLGSIVPVLVLGVVFFVILVPVATVYRLLGPKDPLALYPTRDSQFEETDRQFDQSYFEQPW